jgi:hypothetical protein
LRLFLVALLLLVGSVLIVTRLAAPSAPAGPFIITDSPTTTERSSP